jgi:hypothetical protein
VHESMPQQARNAHRFCGLRLAEKPLLYAPPSPYHTSHEDAAAGSKNLLESGLATNILRDLPTFMQTARAITELAALATHSEAASTPSRVLINDIGSVRAFPKCNAFSACQLSPERVAGQWAGESKMKSRMIHGSDTIRHAFDS